VRSRGDSNRSPRRPTGGRGAMDGAGRGRRRPGDVRQDAEHRKANPPCSGNLER